MFDDKNKDIAIIGADGEDTGGSGAGASYIFIRSGSTWFQQKKIQALDVQGGDGLGQSVSVYGDIAIVGARLEDEGGTDAGAAYFSQQLQAKFTQQPHIM